MKKDERLSEETLEKVSAGCAGSINLLEPLVGVQSVVDHSSIAGEPEAMPIARLNSSLGANVVPLLVPNGVPTLGENVYGLIQANNSNNIPETMPLQTGLCNPSLKPTDDFLNKSNPPKKKRF